MLKCDYSTRPFLTDLAISMQNHNAFYSSPANGDKLNINSSKSMQNNTMSTITTITANNIITNNRSNESCEIKSITRNESYGSLMSTEGKEAWVHVLYTGGTIGMVRNDNNVLAPIPNALIKQIRKYPSMHDEKYAKERFGASAAMAPLILPYVQDASRRVIYQITEYDPLLDSSNMTMHDWARIAKDIQESYAHFDGFVVLHGTDTLSYTASALSFMLENLGKTVIITGSQIPIFETRTDGRDNFTSALIVAGNYVIPEVCVFFNNKLMRGNRTIKTSANSLDAFTSPNVPPLAHIGINVEIDYRSIFRPYSIQPFTVQTDFDEYVGILRIFPSITKTAITAFLAPPMKGVVLQSFGSGNVPSNRTDLLDELKQACARGVIIVNCTQCQHGTVAEIYQVGKVLFDVGVIPGFDMTPETALTKLSYVLSKSDLSLESKKQMMKTNLRGELTATVSSKMEEFDLVDAVARSLHMTSPQELDVFGATLFPAMLNAAVLAGDIKKINNLKSCGADLSGTNHDHRTPLHLACNIGDLVMVNHLLLNGVSVHIRDRYDRTPLLEAIYRNHHDIIKLLTKCGAHLTGSLRSIGDQLCSAAARGNLPQLESFKLAGADMSQEDSSGRTALHVAAQHGHTDCVNFLLKYIDDKEKKDMLGLTPLNYAEKANQHSIIEILS